MKQFVMIACTAAALALTGYLDVTAADSRSNGMNRPVEVMTQVECMQRAQRLSESLIVAEGSTIRLQCVEVE